MPASAPGHRARLEEDERALNQESGAPGTAVLEFAPARKKLAALAAEHRAREERSGAVAQNHPASARPLRPPADTPERRAAEHDLGALHGLERCIDRPL